MKIYIILCLFITTTFFGQTNKEKLIIGEANKRNINTTEEAINELNRNGISIIEAQEMARAQGIDFNTFLLKNFGNTSDSELNKKKLIDELEVVDKIEIVSNDTLNLPQNSTKRFEKNQNKNEYFGYSIFENNPFATKNYLVGNIDEGYLLSPGDELRITVYGNNSLTTLAKIDLNGNIIFPDLGVFQAAGNSLKTLNKRLRLFLGKFYNGLVSNPQNAFLDVSLTQIRPVSVNILGEIVTPGPHLVNGYASVLNAIYSAGGIKTSGSLRKVFLYRNDKLIKEFDLYDYITNGRIDSDVRVMSGDVIFVPARLNEISLMGAVKKAAIFEIKDDESLSDLVKYSGGLNANTSRTNVNISRIIEPKLRIPSQKYDRYLSTIDFSKNLDFKLYDGDVITFSPILDKVLNQVTISGSVNSPGIFSIEKYSDLQSLIFDGAQGLAPNTFLSKVDVFRQDIEGNKSFETYNLNDIISGSINLDLQQDDNIRIYSLEEVEGLKTVTVEGYGIDAKTVFWSKNLSIYDLIFESSAFNSPNFKSSVLDSRVDVESFNTLTGNYSNKIYSLNDSLTLSNTPLKPQDNVRLYSKNIVEKLKKSFSIMGAIKNPMMDIKLRDNMYIEDAILIAGGFNDFADQNFVRIIRKNLFSESEKFSETIIHEVDNDYLTGKSQSPSKPFLIKDLDIINIRLKKRDDMNSSITLSGEISYPGLYALNSPDSRLEDIIEDANGFTKYAHLESSQLFRDNKQLSFKNSNQLLMQKLKNNDLVIIGSALNDVNTEGDGIVNPTSFSWQPNKKVRFYLRNSGGLKKRLESLTISRNNGSNKKVRKIFSNPMIMPGDVIVAKQKPEKKELEKNFFDEFLRIFGSISGILTTIILVDKI